MTKDKEAVEQEMQESWQDLCAVLDSVSDAEQEQPGVVEGWSVKDMLGHITFWAEKAGRDLRLLYLTLSLQKRQSVVILLLPSLLTDLSLSCDSAKAQRTLQQLFGV